MFFSNYKLFSLDPVEIFIFDSHPSGDYIIESYPSEDLIPKKLEGVIRKTKYVYEENSVELSSDSDKNANLPASIYEFLFDDKGDV